MPTDMKIEYWFEMPNKWTFKQSKLLKFINRYIPLKSLILIPFAGHFRFGEIDHSEYVYNDINPRVKADHHIMAYKLAWLYHKDYFECIIADPPFTHYQAVVKYQNKKMQKITRWRETARYLLMPGGIYIELGYNSAGIKGLEKIALGICQIGGSHNDILILVQKKHGTLERWL